MGGFCVIGGITMNDVEDFDRMGKCIFFEIVKAVEKEGGD
jgi:hypothetical protein